MKVKDLIRLLETQPGYMEVEVLGPEGSYAPVSGCINAVLGYYRDDDGIKHHEMPVFGIQLF